MNSRAEPPSVPPPARTPTELFHRINRVIPEDQKEVLTVRAEDTASEALRLLKQHGFSQVPVLISDEVLGIFSYRSFSDAIVRIASSRPGASVSLEGLTAEECVEPAHFARVTDEFETWFETLDRHNAVLVGEARRLQAIVTPMDVLRYLYRVASHFVLVGEIELALRALMQSVASPEALKECARVALSGRYTGQTIPEKLEDMTFHDYVQIVGDGRNWPLFAPIFRGTRERTRARLEEITELRNDVFHFRSPSVDAHERLANHRDWMLMRARAAEVRARDVAK